MAGLIALCMLLVLLPLSCAETTLLSEQSVNPHPASGAAPLPSPRTGDQPRKDGTSTTPLNAKQTYAHIVKDKEKVGVFIAAAMGTILMMAAVYCIYNKYYTKHQYLHAHLQDDTDLALDSTDHPPMYFHGSVGFMDSMGDVRKPSYGALSDTPSIISIPPSLSPPPSLPPPSFPPLFLSSPALRTISAKDLEKSFV